MTQASEWAASVLMVAFAYAARASILLGAALLVNAALRRASAAARHLVWTAAVAGVLVLPAAALVVPRWDVPLLPAEPTSLVAAVPVHVAAAPSGDAAVTGASAPVPPGIVSARPPARSPAATAPVRGARLDALRELVSTRVMLAVLVLGLSGILLLRLAIANARLASWERGAAPVENPRALALLLRLRRQHGIRRPVTLLESDRTDVPVTWGVVYPVILIPAAWTAWDEEQRIAVLTHELAHVKRFDALTQQLAQAMAALLWFNPLVWVALRRMRLEREHACDDFVLEAGARATRYADDLLGLARRLTRRTAPAAAALAMARRSELEGRLLAILDPRARRGSVRRARIALTVAAAMLLCVPLAAFSPSARAAAPLATSTASPAPALPASRAPVVASAQPAAAPQRASQSLPDAAATDLPPRGSATTLVPRLLQTPTFSRLAIALPDTDPARPVDIETLIEVTRAVKRMTSDTEKGQLLALIATRYQRNSLLRDEYLAAVMTMTSDTERGTALLALLERDSLPRGAVAQVLRATAAMTSDASKSAVLQRISPAIYADTAVQQAYLDAIVGMSSDSQRGAALAALLKQNSLTPQMQLALLRAIAPMSSDAEKANALTLFLERQGLADDRVRRAFFAAAETLTSDSDYRRLMTAVMK